jgi:hypothetical protein
MIRRSFSERKMGKPHNVRLLDQNGKAWFATEELVAAAAVFPNEGTSEYEPYYKLEDGRKLTKLPDGKFQTEDSELTLTKK